MTTLTLIHGKHETDQEFAERVLRKEQELLPELVMRSTKNSNVTLEYIELTSFIQ